MQREVKRVQWEMMERQRQEVEMLRDELAKEVVEKFKKKGTCEPILTDLVPQVMARMEELDGQEQQLLEVEKRQKC